MIQGMLRGETIQSMLPWDIPWWMPDHAMFFGVLYVVLGVMGLGILWVVVKSVRDMSRAQARDY